jgi:hypothetical protein
VHGQLVGAGQVLSLAALSSPEPQALPRPAAHASAAAPWKVPLGIAAALLLVAAGAVRELRRRS